jgi:hypothetical protein
MVEEPDAESLHKERERRMAEERIRIDRDRRERELELARLRRSDLLENFGEPVDGRPPPPPPRIGAKELAPGRASAGESPGPSPSSPRAASVKGIRVAPTPQRPDPSGPVRGATGQPILSEALRRFMAVDPVGRFDIQLLNTLPFFPLVEDAQKDPGLLESLKDRSAALMARVKSEVDDPLSAGAFLREQVLLWYRRSPEDAEWTFRMPERWAGLFADSRVTGGRLQAWLNSRLLAVYQGAIRAGRFGARLRHGIRPSRALESATGRTAHQQIQGEAAQALLDDLAAHPREGEGPFPLVRLSELAVRRQVQTVNDALSLLFNSRESGPFIVLHPNRYPDCDEVQIRPPSPAASGAALAFVLVSSKVARRSGGRGSSTASSRGAPGAAADTDGDGLGEEANDGITIWEDASATAASWRQLVSSYRQERKRLEAPPRDYRVRPAYAALRDNLVDDAEFRVAFLATHWRGRPAGLPLLVGLLLKGSLSPQIATDHEYLEAELGVLTCDDPEWQPEGGVWTFRGWTVTRREAPGEGRRYLASRNPETPA